MTSLADPPNPAAAASHALLVRRRRRSALGWAVLLVLLAAGFRLADLRNAGGFAEGLSQILDYPSELLAEAWARRAALPGHMWRALPALVETLDIALAATLAGAAGGAVLALLATPGLAPWPWLVGPVRRLLDIARAIPDLVIALVLIFVLGAGPVPAATAIAIHSVGALGKLFSEVAQNASPQPIEGLQSVGAGWLARMRFGLLPQVAPNWASYAMLRLEINIRSSAILGFVGAGGIGYELRNAISWGQGRHDVAAAIFLMLFATIVLFDQLTSALRDRLAHGRPAGRRTRA